jgi:hypothetical protein
MRIDIEYRWRFGQVKFENGLIGDVRAGKADLGVVGSRAWDSVGLSSFRALDAPLLIDSYALQDRVVRSPMIGQMLQGAAAARAGRDRRAARAATQAAREGPPAAPAIRLRGAQDRGPAIAGR